MGFFDSLTGAQEGTTVATPATGFRAWPTWMQDVYRNIGKGVQSTMFTGEGVPNSAMFTPMGVTPDEQRAFEMMRAGFTPTPESLNADIGMFQNPFNESVINDINRQAGGEYSILKQAMTDAGQFGSNRQMLGANDIDLTRTNQIGRFLQDQFNNSMKYALQMPAFRSADAAGLAGIGDFTRNLDMQTKQAPVAALQAAGGLVNPLNAIASNPGQAAGTMQIGGKQSNFLDTAMNLGRIASGISGMGAPTGWSMGQEAGSWFSPSPMGPYQNFSDRRLKENIEHAGNENGFNIYKFNYKGNDQKYIGVMADEVKETMPDAVGYLDDYMTVDYRKIGVNFRKA